MTRLPYAAVPFTALALAVALPAAAEQAQGDHLCFRIDPVAAPAGTEAACTDILLNTDGPPEAYGYALMSRGMAFRELRRFEEAEADLLAALDLLGEDPQALRMLAWTYREWDRPAEAEGIYTRVLKIDDHWQGWLSRCVVREDMEKWTQAVDDCRKALEQDPKNVDTLYFLARGLSFLNLPDEAFVHARLATELAPDIARNYAELAWARWLMGDKEGARGYARLMLDRFPKDPSLEDFLTATE